MTLYHNSWLHNSWWHLFIIISRYPLYSSWSFYSEWSSWTDWSQLRDWEFRLDPQISNITAGVNIIYMRLDPQIANITAGVNISIYEIQISNNVLTDTRKTFWNVIVATKHSNYMCIFFKAAMIFRRTIIFSVTVSWQNTFISLFLFCSSSTLILLLFCSYCVQVLWFLKKCC